MSVNSGEAPEIIGAWFCGREIGRGVPAISPSPTEVNEDSAQ